MAPETSEKANQSAKSVAPAMRAQSLPADIERIREIAAKAPPGSMRLGTPLTEEQFLAMRAKQGLPSRPVKIPQRQASAE